MLSRRDTCKDSKLTFSSNVFELKNNLRCWSLKIFSNSHDFVPTMQWIRSYAKDDREAL